MDNNADLMLCFTCARANVPSNFSGGKLMQLPTSWAVAWSWSHKVLNFVTDLPEFSGYIVILLFLDHFSCVLRLIFLPVLSTAFEVPELLFNHVFCNFSIPEDVVSDRGPQVISKELSGFMEMLGEMVSLTSVYHPLKQASGVGEPDVSPYILL